MTSNEINFWRQQEDARHNLAFEKETHRHNVRTEEISEKQAGAALMTAQINAMYAGAYAQAAIWGAQAQLTNASAAVLNAQVNQQNADLAMQKFTDESQRAWNQYQLDVTKFDWSKSNAQAGHTVDLLKAIGQMSGAIIGAKLRADAQIKSK